MGGWKGVAGWGRCGLVWADEESGELSMDIKAFLYLAALVPYSLQQFGQGYSPNLKTPAVSNHNIEEKVHESTIDPRNHWQ